MTMDEINPIELKGNWTKGFALDIHVISSVYLGDNEWGYPQFDTKRSPLGELVFRLKYRSDKSVVDAIVQIVVDFLTKKWHITEEVDFLIPIPPSRARTFQPVLDIAERVGTLLNVPIYVDALRKIMDTPELKNRPPEERKAIVAGVFDAEKTTVQEKSVLLFDDLYSSGATLTEATRILYEVGKVHRVYVLTLTKTGI
ncbi:MAG: ComF family protein [Chloroflexi bacterium]|nr:ComF family protein [Chloroflexota bacterium]